MDKDNKQKFWDTLRSPIPDCTSCIHDGKSINVPSPCFTCGYNDAIIELRHKQKTGITRHVRYYTMYEWNGNYE